jgi:phosphoglucosamine mutase
MPTPGIAFLTQSMRCDAGIQISASHNAFHDNGIKIFAEDGFKIPDSIESEIERLVHSGELDKFRPTAENVGKAFRIEDALGRYIVQLKNTFPRDLTLEGVRIVLDCANGAFYKGAPLVFEELGAEVIKRGVNPTGLNINDKVGALYPENVAAAAVEYRADLGVSLDGDGDRVVLADETGAVVDGDQIMAICALEMQREGTLNKDTLVVTPMSNIGLELGLAQHGIKVIRAQVGDRYVVDTMRKGDYSLGGEQSGHIVLLEHAKTGDGVVAALKVLAIMQRTGKKLSELKKCITLYPQVRHDVRITRREPLDQLKEVQDEIKAAEKALQNKGRVFVRLSGTEPLARVLVEGENASEISHFAQRIGASIHKALG